MAKGRVIAGSFVGHEEDDLYIWIRRFESEEERQRQYDAIYQSDHWKTAIAPRIPEMMDHTKVVVRRIAATQRSVVQ